MSVLNSPHSSQIGIGVVDQHPCLLITADYPSHRDDPGNWRDRSLAHRLLSITTVSFSISWKRHQFEPTFPPNFTGALIKGRNAFLQQSFTPPRSSDTRAIGIVVPDDFVCIYHKTASFSPHTSTIPEVNR